MADRTSSRPRCGERAHGTSSLNPRNHVARNAYHTHSQTVTLSLAGRRDFHPSLPVPEKAEVSSARAVTPTDCRGSTDGHSFPSTTSPTRSVDLWTCGAIRYAKRTSTLCLGRQAGQAQSLGHRDAVSRREIGGLDTMVVATIKYVCTSGGRARGALVSL